MARRKKKQAVPQHTMNKEIEQRFQKLMAPRKQNNDKYSHLSRNRKYEKDGDLKL